MSTQLKFDGPRLDEVLERVGRELGPQAIIVEANRGRRGGVGGFFAREWFEVIVEAPAPPAGDEAAADPMSDAAFLALADRVSDVVEAKVGTDEAPEPTSNPFDRILAQVGAPAVAESGASVATSAPGRSMHPTSSAPRVVAASPSLPAAPTSLGALDLRSMLDVLDRTAPVVTSVLDHHPSAIVAVVGDLAVGRRVAADIAARAGMEEGDVLVACPVARDDVPSWLRLDGPATTAARVDRWRRSDRPVVVAVDLAPGRDGHAWAADVLAAIGADEVRLVARAWQVTDELGPKAAVLGGIDGIELVEVDASAEPEAFLDLDLPVMGIDGRVATPELWAALLLERRNDVAL